MRAAAVNSSHALIPQRSIVGLVQNFGPTERHFKLYLSILESELGALPDWKRTAFWEEDSFLQARQKAQELSRSRLGNAAQFQQSVL